MAILQRIQPCLWFDDQAEQAAKFYTGIFKKARIVRITRYGKAVLDEIDFYWDKLSAGGDPKAQHCGWLKDKRREKLA